MPVSESVDKFRFEGERYKSFLDFGWSLDFQSPVEMAKAGFYYTGHEDTVRCYFCRVDVGNWEPSDIPIEDHRRWSPRCPFANGQETTNVPLPIYDYTNSDETSPADLQAIPEEEEETNRADHGITDKKQYKPMFFHFATEQARLETFKLWPPSIPVSPFELAEAGFYYTGFSDKCVCFYCGVIIRNWFESNDPWDRHALGRKYTLPIPGDDFSAAQLPCKFLLLSKGKAFIDKYINDDDTCKGQNEECQDVVVTENEDRCVAESEANSLSEKNCNVCYKRNGQEICLLPCAHVVACTNCSLALKDCPICRSTIQAVLRVFIS